jgi:hypothetical protein
MKGRHPAVASAVTALHVASECAFPEKLSEWMLVHVILNKLTLKFERDLLSQ